MSHSNSVREIYDLKELSRKVGIDPLQVQAAGGNTSVKVDNTLWIKASGTCLADACSTDLMVPVDLAALLHALEKNDPRAEKSTDFVVQSLNASGLRPSIETTVHAVLPQKVVIHVHCVDTIAIAIQSNGESKLEQLLADFNWLWVPYKRPGLPLSRYISSAISPGTDVVVLGNHGLVVAAETVALAETLLERVRRAVKQPVKTTQTPDIELLNQLASATDYLAAPDQATHAVAMDESTVRMAAGGSLYPDHVIFLGDGSTIIDPDKVTDKLAELKQDPSDKPPGSIIVPGAGVLMRSSATAAEHALARCLSNVCIRADDAATMNYLNSQQVYELLNWEAETYRQSLAGN